jgi:hypothetical protein
VPEHGLGDRAEVELARFRWPVADPGEFLACQGVTDLGVARPHHADEAVLEQLAVREPAQAPVELGRDDQGVRLAARDHLRKALGQRLDPDEQVEIDPVAFLGSSSWRSSIAADDAQVGKVSMSVTLTYRQSSRFFAVFCPYCPHQGEVIVWIHLPASQGGLDVR